MINWILYKIGEFIALTLGQKGGYLLAYFICRLKYLISRTDRRAVIYNLERVVGKDNPKRIRRLAKEVFVNFGEYLVDFFRFSRINKDFIKRHVEIRNLKYLDEALEKGRGVILVSAHIGNWELGAAVVSQLGYPLYAIALSHAHRKVNDFFDRQRALCGVKVVAVGAGLKQCFKLLKNNYATAFLGDRDFGKAGVHLTFCGKEATIPRGAARFCLKTKAMIVPVFSIKKGAGKFLLAFEKPISATGDAGELKDELELIKEYLRIIETYVKQYPSQWYMFQPFFSQ